MRILRLLLLILLLLPSASPAQSNKSYPKHIQIALSYVGTTELTGRNDGPEVEMFQNYVKIHKHDAWCGAFVGFCIGTAGAKEPKIRSGLAVGYIDKTSIKASDVLRGARTVPDGSIVIFRHGSTIHGHTGFVIHWNGKSGTTVEGNTSSSMKGSQDEGEGVYRKTRTIQPANFFRIVYFTPVTY